MLDSDEYSKWVGTIGVALVTSSVIITHHFLTHDITDVSGLMLFFIGWMLIALSAANFTTDWKKIGTTIFVVIATMITEYCLTNNNKGFILFGGILFAAYWYFISSITSYSKTTNKIDWQKCKNAYIGSTLVLMCIMNLTLPKN